MTDDEAARPRRRLKSILIAATVLAALALLPASCAAMMSPMMADSGANPAVMTFIILVMSFPLALLVLPVLAWVAFSRRHHRTTWLLIALLIAWPAAAWLAIRFGGSY